MSKIFESCSDFSSTKEAVSKITTPVRNKRNLSIDSNECKTEGRAKDSEVSKESITQKDGETKPNTQSLVESPLRKSHEVLDCAFKEEVKPDETSLQIVMHKIYEQDRHLFRKTQANKIIKLDINSQNLVDFLESKPANMRG